MSSPVDDGSTDATEVAARYLIATHPTAGVEIDWRVRRVLEAGMFVTYARAFNESRGDPPLPPAPTSGLTPSERSVHDWAIEERSRVWAHVDRGSHRRLIEGTIEGAKTSLFETWRPPSPEQLESLADLAESAKSLPPRGGSSSSLRDLSCRS
jgi:hypothetical protein